MGRTNKIADGKDTPGLTKDAGNALLSHFGFKIKGGKGDKVPKFPVKESGRPCKIVHPGRPRNMDSNELSSEAVVVLPYKDDGKEGSTKIVYAVPCEDDEGSKKAISDMDEEVLPLEEGDNKAIVEKNLVVLVEAVLCVYAEGAKKESSEMGVEALPLEEDAENANRENNLE